MTLRDWAEMILEERDEEALLLDGYDKAIVGIMDGRVVYDEERIIDIIMSEGATNEEAWDHYGFNILGSIQPEGGYPLFIRTPTDLERSASWAAS